MPRSGPKRKVRVSVSLDADLLKWTKSHVGLGKRFSSLTHAVESALVKLQSELR